MRIDLKIILALFLLLGPLRIISPAEEPQAPAKEEFIFQGEISEDGINIRTDSTVSAEAICSMNKGEYVEIVKELYDWYRIRLPANAPSYIHKDFVAKETPATANPVYKVTKNNVNVRLRPDIASAILGKVNKGDTLNIQEDSGEWLKIAPVKSSFGWVHKKFVEKTEKKKIKVVAKPKEVDSIPATVNISVEGVIRPKTITNIASHKLITADKNIYLLRGNPDQLDPLNRKRAKVSGRLITPTETDIPMIEVEKIEVLD